MIRPRSMHGIPVLTLLPVVLASCGRPDGDAAPTLRPGRDECVECGMIIADDRFAAAIIPGDAANPEPLLFDDIGDMFAFEQAHPEIAVRRRYVHDFQTRVWIDMSQSVIVRSEHLRSPMGYGLAAIHGGPDAETRAASFGAAVVPVEKAMRVKAGSGGR